MEIDRRLFNEIDGVKVKRGKAITGTLSAGDPVIVGAGPLSENPEA